MGRGGGDEVDELNVKHLGIRSLRQVPKCRSRPGLVFFLSPTTSRVCNS